MYLDERERERDIEGEARANTCKLKAQILWIKYRVLDYEDCELRHIYKQTCGQSNQYEFWIIFMIPLKVHPHIHNYFKVDSVLIIAKLRKHICTHLIYTHTDTVVCTVGIYWKGQQTKEPTIKKRFTRTNHGIGSLRSDRIGPMRAFENVTLLFHGHCQWIECDCLFVVVHNAWNIE